MISTIGVSVPTITVGVACPVLLLKYVINVRTPFFAVVDTQVTLRTTDID